MLQSVAGERLAMRLMDHDPSGQILFRSSDILWNLLENGDRENVAKQLNNLTCIGYVSQHKKTCHNVCAEMKFAVILVLV